MKISHFCCGAILIGLLVAVEACRGTPPNPPTTPPPPISSPILLDEAGGAPEYVCEFADTPITIDGKAVETAWKRAPVIDNFIMPWTADKRRPKNATRARVLWDREFFYFFAEMDDPDLVARPTEHNGRVWENDCFEVFLKPAADKPGYYEFEVNADNVTFEMYIPDREKGGWPEFKDKHPFKFDTAVVLRGAVGKHTEGGGWSVEGKLRWADFGNTGGWSQVNERWKFALCRVDFSDLKKQEELSTIAPLTKASFHRHEEYATLRFAPPTGKERAFGIDRRTPWTTSHLVGYPEPPPAYHIERAFAKLKIVQPVYVIEEPGTNDLLIVQHLGHWAGPGKIVRVKNDPGAESTRTIVEDNELIYSLCFHPRYAENHYLYTLSNGPVNDPNPLNHVTRWTMDPKTGAIDPKSKRVIIEWESNGHNGGGIDFGSDGLLYFATGDTSTDSDRNNRGQDLAHLSSAMIRIDVDHPEGGKNYGVPKDNPFVNTPGVRPEIWAHGFRNPWRQCFDKKTGALWVGQNGQDLWEPIYVVHRGENYGWPVYEGSHAFHSHRKLETRTKLATPVIEHHHSQARSITGGVVYYGDKFPELNGAYVYGDFSTGRIWAARYDGRQVTWHKEIARTTAQITNFYADRHGELFICDDAGDVWKLVPNAMEATPTVPFPRLLSRTGLFSDTARHQVDPGLIPYDVNSPLWSDGASKQRYIALPAGTQIEYTPARGWNFPDGGALVKTFSLDLEEGNPASRRRLETRVMLKQGGNWVGYTYLWNDAQTDATLAPPEGLDQTFTIKDPAAPGGERRQVWHYPSRAECLYCHSRAANFALGLSDLQMNRDFDYGGGRVDNQMRTLEHLGVFKVDVAAAAKEQIKRESHLSDVDVEKLTDTTGQRAGSPSDLLPRSPGELKHLVNPADPAQSLDARARSYLQANCAHCHVEAGGGNASVDLEFTTAANQTRMFGVAPQSNLLGIADAKLVAMGHPEKSVVYHRLATRGPGQMPPAGSNVVDARGAALVREWIERMPASTQPTR